MPSLTANASLVCRSRDQGGRMKVVCSERQKATEVFDSRRAVTAAVMWARCRLRISTVEQRRRKPSVETATCGRAASTSAPCGGVTDGKGSGKKE